jgi:predicted transcriptional regulator
MALGKRRSKGQIVYQILSLCNGKGVRKTRIVYAINLNFANAADFLDLLIRRGLLEAGKEKAAKYRTTQKGIELLEHFKAIQEEIPEICV